MNEDQLKANNAKKKKNTIVHNSIKLRIFSYTVGFWEAKRLRNMA